MRVKSMHQYAGALLFSFAVAILCNYFYQPTQRTQAEVSPDNLPKKLQELKNNLDNVSFNSPTSTMNIQRDSHLRPSTVTCWHIPMMNLPLSLSNSFGTYEPNRKTCLQKLDPKLRT